MLTAQEHSRILLTCKNNTVDDSLDWKAVAQNTDIGYRLTQDKEDYGAGLPHLCDWGRPDLAKDLPGSLTKVLELM